MSQIKPKSIDSDDEALQAILRAVTSVQREAGFGSIEITIHEGRVTQIEKREKIRITQDRSENQDKAEKQSLDKFRLNRQNLENQNLPKQGAEKQGNETLSINKQKRELSSALHN